MSWFTSTPRPMALSEGEPIHAMVARAFLEGAIKFDTEAFGGASFHFVGPHGISYKGSLSWLEFSAEGLAARCEGIQRDFNARMAALRETMVAAKAEPTFKSLLDE